VWGESSHLDDLLVEILNLCIIKEIQILKGGKIYGK